MKKFIFFSAVMMLLSFTSCTFSSDDWPAMVFVCEEATIDASGSIAVPAQGGTYHVKCTNYEDFWLSENSLWENDKYPAKEPKEDVSELKGEWTEVVKKKDVMTVSIGPNGSGEKRKSAVYVQGGDVYGRILFNQAAE